MYLPCQVAYGYTLDEGIEKAKEAIELYIESLKARGEEIPAEENMLEYTLSVDTNA